MDLDFLTKMLGGSGEKSANPLMTLLPLLLGGKGGDLSSLLGGGKSHFSMGASRDDNTSFPPLFGSSSGNSVGENGLMNLLGNFFPTKKESSQEKPSSAYPYELQYNRPPSSAK